MPRTRKSVALIDRRKPLFHPVEISVMSALVRDANFDHQIVTECVERGFLPGALGEALTLVKFLSRTVLAAQGAQRAYGVPASFLIGVGIYDSGWDADRLCKSVDHGSGSPGREPHLTPEMRRYFMHTARLLAESKKYSGAMKFVHCVDVYAKELCSRGYRTRLDMEDILSPIERYELRCCDLGAMLEPNEYNMWRFTEYRDACGARKLRPSLADMFPLEAAGKVAALAS